jgi:formamidopyrimidine-DNA glycosylase
MLKQVLVGKDAIIVGLSNSAFQDIIYRAGVHPKKRGSDLGEKEVKTLYYAILDLIEERIQKRGKNTFTDIFMKKGEYVPLMGSNMKEQPCPKCGSMIQKISHGGGSVYLCPNCQK